MQRKRAALQYMLTKEHSADHSGRAVYGVVLRPFACWDCGFESRRRVQGCLSLVSVVCCRIEVSASG
jgi:predicted Zn-ribbon and HTH transcriptional regulator